MDQKKLSSERLVSFSIAFDVALLPFTDWTSQKGPYKTIWTVKSQTRDY